MNEHVKKDIIKGVDLSVNICGVNLRNPVITASGTCGCGEEYAPWYSAAELGAISVKAVTLEPREGNEVPRICETPSGILNAIGLQNKGVYHFVEHDLPRLKSEGAVVIVNLAGRQVSDYAETASIIDGTDADMIELNISCPNVHKGGMAFGTDKNMAAELVSEIRRCTSKPLIVKLTPNVTDITEIALAVEAAGADAISLINTLLGMRIDIRTRRPMLANITGGLSGPAVFPVALRMVWQVKSKVRIPVIGMGGISTGEDAVEMMLAGADAIMVGTAMFADPLAPIRIRDGIADYCADNGLPAARELTGGVIIG